MTITTTELKSNNTDDSVKVLFNDDGYVDVEHIMFWPDDDDSENDSEYEGWHKTISSIDSEYIKNELIEKGDFEYHAVKEMSFKKDGF